MVKQWLKQSNWVPTVKGTPKKELYRMYLTYCMENEYKPETQNKLGRAIRAEFGDVLMEYARTKSYDLETGKIIYPTSFRLKKEITND